MKGASDGGMFVPHSEQRFPGYDRESKSLDAEVLRSYIFGGHVAKYMREMQEENEEKYQRHFAKFIKAGIHPDQLEEMYTNAHAAIRENPDRNVKEKSEKRSVGQKVFKAKRGTLEQRRARIEKRKARLFARFPALAS
ncbi:60S ribosomal protein L5 [Coelomomyces lativittatus]|nr:60S ribosomal protein L5 [Coelomomyces lativittatus]